jgi:hypothetical protein
MSVGIKREKPRPMAGAFLLTSTFKYSNLEEIIGQADVIDFIMDMVFRGLTANRGFADWSGVGDTEELGHLIVEEAVAGAVGLDPFAVDDKLRDGTLAYVGEDEIGSARRVLDIDFFEGDVVGGEEALRFAAVAAPVG